MKHQEKSPKAHESEPTYTWVRNAEELAKAAKHLRVQEMVAFDTEFIRENTFFPILELLQVASDSEIFLIDMQCFRGQNKVGLGPLVEIFRNRNILKIGHALQADQECLFTEFEVVASPTYDTAIAGALLGCGDSPGLAALMQDFLKIKLKKGHARTQWGHRPLSRDLCEYAADDVRYLHQLVRAQREKLDELGRLEWVLELSAKWEDTLLYSPDYTKTVQDYCSSTQMDNETYAVFHDLYLWRERRAREVDIPRRRLAEDSVIMDIAKAKPTDAKQLGAFRGLNRGEVDRHSETILAVIRDAIKKARTGALKQEIKKNVFRPSDGESLVLEFLKFYLKILADETKVVPRFLCPTPNMLLLVRAFEEFAGVNPTADKVTKVNEVHAIDLIETWVSRGVLSRNAARLIGFQLFGFLSGQIGFIVKNARIRAVDLRKLNK